MHSFWHRVNTIISLFAIVAGSLCLLTATTDVFHNPSPPVNISLGEVLRFVPFLGTKEQAVLTFNVDADLRPAFSWNTKQLFVYVLAEYESPENRLNQIVIWDKIIENKDDAVLQLRDQKQKYPLMDRIKSLRGAPFNLSLVWSVMPRVGYLYSRQSTVAAGVLPESYVY